MSQPAPAAPTAALSPHDRRRIAVAASCDPDCVAKYVKGQALRSTTIDRIERAMRNLKFDALIDARVAALEAAARMPTLVKAASLAPAVAARGKR